MDEKGDRQNLFCIGCIYFHVTWDKHFPRGCKLFGFKSREFPNLAVREATGAECTNYVKKDTGFYNK